MLLSFQPATDCRFQGQFPAIKLSPDIAPKTLTELLNDTFAPEVMSGKIDQVKPEPDDRDWLSKWLWPGVSKEVQETRLAQTKQDRREQAETARHTLIQTFPYLTEGEKSFVRQRVLKEVNNHTSWTMPIIMAIPALKEAQMLRVAFSGYYSLAYHEEWTKKLEKHWPNASEAFKKEAREGYLYALERSTEKPVERERYQSSYDDRPSYTYSSSGSSSYSSGNEAFPFLGVFSYLSPFSIANEAINYALNEPTYPSNDYSSSSSRSSSSYRTYLDSSVPDSGHLVLQVLKKHAPTVWSDLTASGLPSS